MHDIEEPRLPVRGEQVDVQRDTEHCGVRDQVEVLQVEELGGREFLPHVDVGQHDDEEQTAGSANGSGRTETERFGSLLVGGRQDEYRIEQDQHDDQRDQRDDERVEKQSPERDVEVQFGKVGLTDIVPDAEVRVVAQPPVEEVRIDNLPAAGDPLGIDAKDVVQACRAVRAQIGYEDHVAIEVLVPEPQPHVLRVERVLRVVERLAHGHV